MKHGVYLME